MSKTRNNIPLPLKKSIQPLFPVELIVPCPDGGFLVHYKALEKVSRYDAGYNLLWTKPLGILTQKFSRFELTVSPDGNFIGVHGPDEIRIYDENGTILHGQTHTPWKNFQSSEIYFSPTNGDGKNYIWFVEPSEKNGGFLQVLDASDFSLIDRIREEDIDNHYSFHATPDKDKTFIQLAAGQDPSRLLQVQLMDRRIIRTELDDMEDMIMGSFSPAGNELILTPHSEEDAVGVYAFPENDRIAEIDQEALFEDISQHPAEKFDKISYSVSFLTPEIILAQTETGRFLLIDRNSFEYLGELQPEGCKINGHDDDGKPTSDPEKILGFESEIWDCKMTPTGQLFIIHTSGSIQIYNLPLTLDFKD